MEIYGLKQKKKKKWWLIPVIIIAVILAVIFTVGIIRGSSNSDKKAISEAISENAELKRRIDDLNAQIQSLNEQLAAAQGELASRPTPAPETTPSSNTISAHQDVENYDETSPRNYDE